MLLGLRERRAVCCTGKWVEFTAKVRQQIPHIKENHLYNIMWLNVLRAVN